MNRLIGSILLGVGILIAGASGLCSAGFILFALFGVFQQGSGGLVLLPLVLLVGGVPFAIGFGLYKWGQSLIRTADRET